MRLLHDEQACLRVVNDFVAERLKAATFIPRFQHLWQCDGAKGIDSALATIGDRESQAGLYGVLDSVNDLCTDYASSLPPGRGYRVSEEQFRKEVESLTIALRPQALCRH